MKNIYNLLLNILALLAYTSIGFAQIAETTTSVSLNYYPTTAVFGGSGDIYGCTDPNADNYNWDATIDDGSCYYTVYGCTDFNAINYNSEATQDDGTCYYYTYGCTDPSAANYDQDANQDDGSCYYYTYGCTDPSAANYNPNANYDDGSCYYYYYGCTNPSAANYDPNANVDDGSCIIYGCTQSGADNYNPEANTNDGSCSYSGYGCTDSNADNYDPSAIVDNGSCYYSRYGCTDPSSLNYDPSANNDDGSCVYACEAPTNVLVSNVLSTSATWNWTGDITGAESYQIRFREVGSSQWISRFVDQTMSSRTISILMEETEYEWQIRTNCAPNFEENSEFVTGPNFTTLGACNATVNGITVFASTNWARVRWTSSPNAVSYRIRYRLLSGGPWTSKTITAPTLTRRINGLVENTAYEYTLEGVCANGTRSSQSTGTFTTSGFVDSRLSDATSEEWAFTIHPNPSNGRFTVTPLADVDGVATVQLVDIAGRIVVQQTWNASEDATLVLDKNLDNGMYLLSITTPDGQTFTSRVVIAN